MATYMVTGGAGFIGSHVCGRLVRLGHRVVCVDSFADNYDYRVKIGNVLESFGLPRTFAAQSLEEDTEWLAARVGGTGYRLVRADIRDASAMAELMAEERPEAVIHLAGLPGVRASIEQPLLYEDVNARGTLILLEAMRSAGVRKWLFASSSSIYGSAGAGTPLSEEDPTGSPLSVYAATKKSGELLGHAYAHLHGIDGIMLRLFTVYGERQRPDLAIHKFTALMARGEPLPFYGDGSSVRDYTYVGDTTDGILLALEFVLRRSPCYEIVNLGSRRPVALTVLVRSLEQATGRTAKLDWLPDQPGDMSGTCADIGKAYRLFGYRPTTSFEAGIRRFAQWFMRAGPEADH